MFSYLLRLTVGCQKYPMFACHFWALNREKKIYFDFLFKTMNIIKTMLEVKRHHSTYMYIYI